MSLCCFPPCHQQCKMNKGIGFQVSLAQRRTLFAESSSKGRQKDCNSNGGAGEGDLLVIFWGKGDSESLAL